MSARKYPKGWRQRERFLRDSVKVACDTSLPPHEREEALSNIIAVAQNARIDVAKTYRQGLNLGVTTSEVGEA